MVYFNKQSTKDIDDFVVGLLIWKKHDLSVIHVLKYRDDIVSICKMLDPKSFHFNTQFPIHKRYGEKVHSYRRNKQTYWYIIYNLDPHVNVYIQRILSNHINAET
jgi:hypothetical protein